MHVVSEFEPSQMCFCVDSLNISHNVTVREEKERERERGRERKGEREKEGEGER